MECQKLNYRYVNGGMSIVLPEKIKDKIESLCVNQLGLETGGIIVGYYTADQSTAIVCDVTDAPADSKFGRCKFYRGISGLDKLLKRVWNQGKYYLGEWHYHPDSSPEPSAIDDQQMLKISKNHKASCPEPILLVASDKNRVFSYTVSVYKQGRRLDFYLVKS